VASRWPAPEGQRQRCCALEQGIRAPWSVGSQGRANVSHGCVNAPPRFAKWLYDLSRRGDIVKVSGTDRELEPDNG
jgi:hypothetical protein